MTPHEAWTGQKPSMSNLRIFGCCAYVHVPAKRRSKLGAKATRCVFIGYPPESKAYLLWNPQTGTILVSRDVHFVDDQLGIPPTGVDGGGNDQQSLTTSSIHFMSRDEQKHDRKEQRLDDSDSTYVDEDEEQKYHESDSASAADNDFDNSEPS
jgi:hypothetical protein